MVRGVLAKYCGLARYGTGLAKYGGAAIATVLLTASAGQASPVDEVYQQMQALNQAICFNQWNQAAAITSTLIGSPAISIDYRNTLIAFRRDLEQLREYRAMLPDNASCDRVYPRTLVVPTPEASLAEAPGADWADAVASVTTDRAPVVQFDTRPESEIDPAIPPELLEDSPIVLAAAVPIETTEGFNVVAGEVGTHHQAFSFLAGLGDRITLDLDVIRIFPGTFETSDDSQLFVFDRSGRLIAHNDDVDGRQSLIADFVIPKTDVYFVAVTSHNNDPVFGDDQTLLGWGEDGGARFSYTLTVTGLTPSAALLR